MARTSAAAERTDDRIARRQDPRRARSTRSGTQHKFDVKLVNPANKRRFEIIVVGSGLAGASAAATLGELGYQVKLFTFHDSPRRAHSIAAQGGINAAKNYPQRRRQRLPPLLRHGEGRRLPRPRGATCTGSREVSVNIIDQCVAQGVPFAREYGGLLDNRSFGGAQVSRTFYARGQTGQQLLLGAYQALARQVAPRHRRAAHPHGDARPRGEGRPRRRHRHPRPHHRRGAVARRRTRSCSPPAATATSSTSRPTPRPATSPPAWRAAQAGRAVRQPVLHADPPHLHPAQRRLPVEAHADVGVAAQRRPRLGARSRSATPARPTRSRSTSATTSSSGATPRSATSCRATWRHAPIKTRGRRRPRRRAAEERRVPRLRRTRSSVSVTT